MADQILISFIILGALIFFISGKWRYDIVALLALAAAAVLGLISPDEIFSGFIHPAVVLIVSMLFISKALINSGAIDIITRRLNFVGNHPVIQLGVLVTFTAAISAFINSMGALAFMIPIAVRMAKQSNAPLSMFLMPIAFASHFGGSITLIGSASNIIISEFRAQEIASFNFFDFALAALPVAVLSIFFVVVVGWRLVPKREDVFSLNSFLGNYITEVKIPESSPLVGKTINDFKDFSKEYFAVFALIRKGEYIQDPSPFIVLKKDDMLAIETQKEVLESITTTAKLELVKKKLIEKEGRESGDLEITEVAVSDSSPLVGETARGFGFHRNYRINLLALHRSGGKAKKRLGDIRFKPGDVLLVQGYPEQIERFVRIFNLLYLKERDFHFEGKKKAAVLTLGAFLAAVLVSAAGFFPVHLIFAAAALGMIIAGLVPSKKIYDSIDFSVIILLAVMIQLGGVFYETGAASSFAAILLSFGSQSPEIVLAIILLLSIWLSDILSNVTVAVLLAPVAFSVAGHLGASPDPFLIAVAIGSGSSYLTPIGHQSNTFIMGIGRYRFGDYWRLGLPLEIITFGAGLFFILRFWPF